VTPRDHETGGLALAALDREIPACSRCPRLVRWRERSAAEPPRRFLGQDYWARPVPGFGEVDARIFVLGLAPGAHGANRTGRVFTGDRSGDFLYAALHRAGLATQAESRGIGDGLELRGVRIGCVVRCAPPENAPSPAEKARCLLFLKRELTALSELRVVVALGAFAWDGLLSATETRQRPRPRFAHGAETTMGRLSVLGCYHPSQQNTFTGRLTPAMIDTVVERAKTLAAPPASGAGRNARTSDRSTR
jgi:uracil-DNA glycosylase